MNDRILHWLNGVNMLILPVRVSRWNVNETVWRFIVDNSKKQSERQFSLRNRAAEIQSSYFNRSISIIQCSCSQLIMRYNHMEILIWSNVARDTHLLLAGPPSWRKQQGAKGIEGEKKKLNTDIAYMCAQISPGKMREGKMILICYCDSASVFENVVNWKDKTEKKETLIKCELTVLENGFIPLLCLQKTHAEGTHRCLQIMQQAPTKMSANALNKQWITKPVSLYVSI